MGVRQRRTGRVVLGAVATLALALSGCRSTDDPTAARAEPAGPVTSASTGPTAYPLTIDNCGTKVTFERAPSRVVLLNGASVAEVESFIALGIQDRIIASSQSYGVSDQPGMVDAIKAVPTGGLTLNQNFEVPREQVLALKPDLVISTWAGGFDDKIGSISRERLTAAGIRSYVTPVNCAYGATGPPRPRDEAALRAQSVESSFELLLQLGVIFDVQRAAADHVNKARAALAEVQKRMSGKQPKSVLVVYPGMATMNSSGLPAVFGGGIYDDILRRAGATNPFAGRSTAELAEINIEALAAAKVDVLVIGLFRADENADKFAAELFTRFPGWRASKTRTYTWVSDSFYLGPNNSVAVERIAGVAHDG
jgi:iron complex transport system substrate-binding protein